MKKSIFVALLLVLSVSATVLCQVPDEFVNLKVLPRDISKQDLMKVMRGFTAGLGVRCLFCHVGKEDQPMSTWDFAKDDKQEKKTARIMFNMMKDINQKYLTTLGKPAEQLTQVSCATCHHGLQEPMMMEDVLRDALLKDGPAGATKKYQDLRDKYYGTASFDFSEMPIYRLARSLQDEGKVPEGISILKLGESYYPKSGNIQLLMGDLYLKNGSKDEALQRYKKALDLDPKNEDAKQKIDQLTKPEAPKKP